ncbi:MAG: leucine-rich repeat domain-containing protein [Tannerellaceae bacterium]|jgi:hypothetical protein|nr:leucine-rich repeat domain-containing protein [Tannerellaceae bacterium]
MKPQIQSLICALLLSLAPAGAQTWTLTTTMSATLDAKGTLTVQTTKEGGEVMPDYEYYWNNRAPWYDVHTKIFSAIMAEGITHLGNYAFSWCNNLTSITLPESLASIGGGAFRGCSSLPTITIPVAATSIGGEVFSDCSSLSSATIHATTVAAGSFSGTTINSVTFGPTVKHIGENAFSYCGNLLSVTIPNSVEIIDNGAFSNCGSLVSAAIGDSVTNIGQNAFANTSLISIEIPYSVTNIGTTPFGGCGNLATVIVRAPSIGNTFSGLGITSLTLGDSVKTIGVNAFGGCSKLSSITFGKALTGIGSNAFSGCSALTSVELPSSLKTIGASAFQSDTHLASVSIPASVTEIGANAFRDCKELANITIHWTTPIAIPASAFQGVNPSAATLHVPYGTADLYQAAPVWKDFRIEAAAPEGTIWNLTSTMTATFYEDSTLIIRTTKAGGEAMPDFNGAQAPWHDNNVGNTTIASVVVEEGVTSIGDYAFMWCFSVTSVTLPSTLTAIGTHAFFDCGKLTSVPTLPASVTLVEANAFGNCSTLTAIEVDAANPAYLSDQGVLYTKDRTTLHTFPAGKTGTFVIPSSVRILGESAFHGSKLTSVEIHNEVTTIKSSVFRYCSIPVLNIPASVTSIGYNVFEYSSALTAIHVDAGNTAYTSEDGVLYNKNKTTLICYPAGKSGLSFDIPATVTNIEVSAFHSSTLSSVTIPSSVKTIGNLAFEFCSNLSSISIPASVQAIVPGAFGHCYNLMDVTVHWDEPLAIEDNTFYAVNLSAATLHVPYGTADLYQAAPVWKDFGHIEASTVGNEPVSANALRVYPVEGGLYLASSLSSTLYIYTSTGTLVKRLAVAAGETTAVALPKGLYIVKSERETKKAIVR